MKSSPRQPEESRPQRQWPRLRLRTKLLLAFAVVLLPLVLWMPFEFSSSSRRHLEDALQAQEVVAEALGAEIDAMFDAAIGTGWAIADDPEVKFMQHGRIDDHLVLLASRHPLFDRLAVFDRDGNNRGWGDPVLPAEPRINIADEIYFQSVIATNAPTISQVVMLKRPADTPAVVAAVPIRDEADNVLGVATVVMTTARLAQEYQESRTRAGQAMLLIDRDGRLAFHSRSRRLTEQDTRSFAEFAAVRRAIAGLPTRVPDFVCPIGGNQRLGAFVSTPRHHWVAAVTVPRDVALEPMYASLRSQMMIFSALVLLCIGLALLVARWLVAPVHRLRAHARALGAGDLARRVEIRTGDEMQDLGATFNDMAGQIQQLLEREQTARAEAEDANRTKDHFMAMVSHELRTPLTPLTAAVELLRRMDSLPGEAPALLDLIHRNIELEARLIDDLLDLTRLQQARMQLRHEVVDAHLLIRQVIDIYRNAIENKRLSLELDLGAGAHHFYGDSGRLQQVFWNLIGNAVKFTPMNGSLRIFTDEDQGQIRVGIADSGIGIEPELLPRLFHPFEQGDQARSRRFGGMGLGLAISRGLVEMHGGRIEAFSQGRGAGATFTVTLPLTDAPAAVPEAAVPGPAGHAMRLSILLVDDNTDTLRMLSMLLHEMGHAVRTAATAREALDLASQNGFDLIISDIGLPDATGWELMRQLRGTKPIHGIALSGFGTDDDIMQSRQAGFAGHLTKPINLDQLEAMLAQVPAGHAPEPGGPDS
jgi:signal transduction histidine kinase/ActR/RegA family two-component response regulator